MIKLLIIALCALVGSVSISLLLKDNPGYLLIDVSHWTIQTSFTFAVVLLVLSFIAFYFTIRFFVNLWSAPGDYKRWTQSRDEKRSARYLTKGLLALAEGKWHDAERNVLKNTHQGEFGLLNYLTAARAAQEQGAFERRDVYLKDAHHNMPSADVAVGLTQAELLLSQNQLEQALATLRHLQQLSPKHTHVLKILASLYIDLGDWNHVVELLPMLRKRKIFPIDKINALEEQSYANLLNAIDPKNEKELKELWYRIPSHMQEHHTILALYIDLLIKQDNGDLAEPLIRNALRTKWDNALVRYYGLICGADVKRQLEYAESWLASHENSADLLLALGRLSLRNSLWGKARGYLEASVGADGPPEAHYEFANLLQQMGEQDAALKYYKAGLAKAPGCETKVSFTISAHELELAKAPPKLIQAATGGSY